MVGSVSLYSVKIQFCLSDLILRLVNILYLLTKGDICTTNIVNVYAYIKVC